MNPQPTTGIPAGLLAGGRTADSGFKLPSNIAGSVTYRVDEGSKWVQGGWPILPQGITIDFWENPRPLPNILKSHPDFHPEIKLIHFTIQFVPLAPLPKFPCMPNQNQSFRISSEQKMRDFMDKYPEFQQDPRRDKGEEERQDDGISTVVKVLEQMKLRPRGGGRGRAKT